ncbi:Zinc finger BED domain-containing protein 4 [Eumeta japonica]|uniref:Zinc finger BED domain-containing protein 4 n=1 Tax=Eumeta variegata TaxID=151549 RepID=A0A4C1TD49_EUMVA|nr:Zinc finger BED domain-containing protein 4 [Eumeta japonica]
MLRSGESMANRHSLADSSRFAFIPIAPRHSWVRHWQIPLNKLITHAAAYFLFLILVFIVSNRNKTDQFRGPPNTGVEPFVVIYVLGFAWSTMRLCVMQGPKRYFSELWNWGEIIMILLYLTTFGLWIRSTMDRENEEAMMGIEIRIQHPYKYFSRINLKRFNQPHLNVFQACVTRWNSTFYMFERFLKIKDVLSLYANNNNIESILPEEWKIIECCLEVLQPFEEATREMSSSWAIISSVSPILQMLLKKIDDYLTKPRESDAIRLAVSNLKSQFSAKFSSFDDNNLYAISTYLDPRYKHKFLKLVTEEKIKDEVIKMVNNPVVTDSPTMSPAEKPKRMRMGDSLDPEPGTSSTGKKICLKSDLAMMVDSSSEDEGEGEPDNSSPDAFLRK